MRNSKFKVGDEVYCSYKEENGIVTSIIQTNIAYPVRVKFPTAEHRYTPEGHFAVGGSIRLRLLTKLDKVLE